MVFINRFLTLYLFYLLSTFQKISINISQVLKDHAGHENPSAKNISRVMIKI